MHRACLVSGGGCFAAHFEGGRNRANLAAARAAYDQSVANYRQAVLTAFQEVEDGISNLSALPSPPRKAPPSTTRAAL